MRNLPVRLGDLIINNSTRQWIGGLSSMIRSKQASIDPFLDNHNSKLRPAIERERQAENEESPKIENATIIITCSYHQMLN